MDTDDDGVCDMNLKYLDVIILKHLIIIQMLLTDGSCYPIILGCTDVTACNFDIPSGHVWSDVNTDDGSCTYEMVYVKHVKLVVDNDSDSTAL